ncbi:MAG: hypothetical protein ACRCV9_17150 [Burkholderiaceae bacterium]
MAEPALRLARVLSIAGHPFVFAPAAAVLSMLAGPRGGAMAGAGGALLLALVIGIGVYSWLQVRRGTWQHVDASLPQERSTLNRVALVLMVCAAAGAFALPVLRPAGVGFALGAILIAAGWAGLPRFKLSLHVAFAAFGALLLWPRGGVFVLAGLAFTAAIGWSRLQLKRHTAAEVWVGGAAGIAAGLAVWGLLHQFFGIRV